MVLLFAIHRLFLGCQLVDILDNSRPGFPPQPAHMQVAQNRVEPRSQLSGRVIEMFLRKRPLEAVLHEIVRERDIARQASREPAQIRNFHRQPGPEVHALSLMPNTTRTVILFHDGPRRSRGGWNG
jgi:hypothetical protein